MGRARARRWAGWCVLVAMIVLGMLTLASAWWWVGVLWFPRIGQAPGWGGDAWLSRGNLSVRVMPWKDPSAGGPREIAMGRTSPGAWWPRFDLSTGRYSATTSGVGPPYAYRAPVFLVTIPLAAWAGWRLARGGRRRSPGECPGCGYELGASLGICPECGRERGPSSGVAG
ncbi:MAG: hypothetical protein WD749_01615 [Phycisphaerales bacterium]